MYTGLRFITTKVEILYSEKLTKDEKSTVFFFDFLRLIKQFGDDFKFQLFIKNVNHVTLERHTD